MDVSRITRNRIDLKKRRLELSEVVAGAIETASPLLEERRHTLVVDVASRGLVVDGDSARLTQVVSNLLTNAAKYTEPSGNITITARRESERVVLSVRDDGIGIAPEMLPKVFDLFAQERQALDRSKGGLGLGLAIVRNLVALHGGTVEAHSAGRDRGAEFIVRLPSVAEKAESPKAAPDEPPRVRVHPSDDGLRILVVDDNEDAAELLATSLQLSGHVTQVALNGPDALRAALAFAPDVGLLDIGLPVMDGYELAERLRQQVRGRPLRLVAITGYGQEADRQRSRAAGFDDHLVKPIDMASLAARLKRFAGIAPSD